MEKNAIVSIGSCVKVIILIIIFCWHLNPNNLEPSNLWTLNSEPDQIKFKRICADSVLGAKQNEIPAGLSGAPNV